MENATKALYIAAGVLIGIMILSLAVMLFSSLQSYVEEYKNQIEFNNLNAFNSRYQKYVDDDVTVTIQDVVTVAGMAYEDNSSFNIEPTEWQDISESSLYVGVFLDGNRIDQTIKEDMQSLLTDNTESRYRCTVEYNSIGRIHVVSFYKN